ncbi:hypothetical protein PTTG_29652 [Puccinia triticina 1-1 BBBD Race 1]|uniref:Uncharacterized protein n=1 Tax=Puccinia triticina (isolate 1-1 / race 1 (BBBD)) TaxID=630390 RepID=A0A180G2T1_PUCT1|nr:hypothetical protein PTTG_29652 [Puccinia triticina 1-1 BBBD Race 1]
MSCNSGISSAKHPNCIEHDYIDFTGTFRCLSGNGEQPKIGNGKILSVVTTDERWVKGHQEFVLILSDPSNPGFAYGFGEVFKAKGMAIGVDKRLMVNLTFSKSNSEMIKPVVGGLVQSAPTVKSAGTIDYANLKHPHQETCLGDYHELAVSHNVFAKQLVVNYYINTSDVLLDDNVTFIRGARVYIIGKIQDVSVLTGRITVKVARIRVEAM